MSAKVREKSPARKAKSEQNLQKSYEEQSNDCHQQTLTTELEKHELYQFGIAEALNRLGVKKRNEGDFESALDLHKRALNEQLEQLGPDHLDLAYTYGCQGDVFSAKGDLERACKSHYKALVIQVKKLGDNHIDVAASWDILGNLCRLNGDLEHAEEYLLSALDIRLILLEPNHIEVAISCNNLGDVCCDKDNFERGISYYKRALKIQLEQLPATHIDLSTTYHKLGNACCYKGDLHDARKYQQQALDIRLENFGRNHLDVAASYDSLGNVCSKIKGELKEAHGFYRDALDIKLTLLGPDHVGVAESYKNLADVCFENKDERDSLNYCRRALKIMFKTPKRNQIGVAASSNNEGPRPTQTIFSQDLNISGQESEGPQNSATTYEAEQQQPVIGKTTGDELSQQASKEDSEQFGPNHKDVSAYQGPRPTQTIFCQDLDISGQESKEPQQATTSDEAEQQQPVIGKTTGDKLSQQASKEDSEQFGTNHKDVSAYQGPSLSQDFDISGPESVESQNPTTTCEGEAEQQEPVIGETTGDKEDDEKSQTHKAMKKFKAFQRFHSKKEKEISEKLEERSDKEALNYVFVYQDDEKGFTYSFCRNKEQGVIMLQKKQKSLCAIFHLPGKRKREKLTTKNLANINVELIDPFTEKVILRVKAVFDSGADIASFPLNRQKMKSLVNSFTVLNDMLVPIVYAKIKVNGYLLDGVHEIEIEEDQDWYAIGLPQFARLNMKTKKEILKSFIK
ncbi:uncharacterized protein LOC114535762 isoform X3 [Dendronephthya gigantea]|uniref:uncharacterized protein LOC114535762 isoform X3 n=1 Tax=Dendronephthya gigantea TaxID=151771 RepID=UPI00106B52DD|nr:uncharacterized protein LOC114535762 isoform X3 [Dendronephthya gigantea]